jgi:hypothetical protein
LAWLTSANAIRLLQGDFARESVDAAAKFPRLPAEIKRLQALIASSPARLWHNHRDRPLGLVR